MLPCDSFKLPLTTYIKFYAYVMKFILVWIIFVVIRIVSLTRGVIEYQYNISFLNGIHEKSMESFKDYVIIFLKVT
jgi:hypothetical protein